MSYLLALDQGTTSSRAIVFDRAGAVVGIEQQAFEQYFPQPGWVEHDAVEIATTQLDVAHRVLAQCGLTADAVAAIGITNQRETSLLWERATGQPVGRAIVWQDRRTAAACAALQRDGVEDMVRSKTGLVLDPYFSASKIRWLLDSDSSIRRRAAAGELAWGTIDCWLVWQLTAGKAHVTDATNASRTLLYNIHSGDWDDDLLELWQVPRAILPTVVDSSGVCANATALGGNIPIAGIAGDQQAALFGQACFAPGQAKCTYGTGCFVLLNTGTAAPRSENQLLTTIASRIDGRVEYALEGSVFMGGAVIQWLRDELGLIADAGDSEQLAATVSDTGGVVLVPAFTGLGAPHWNANARALLIGMTRGTNRAHIARAALEAIAWQVTDVAAAMTADAGLELAELRVDGGASNNTLLMQMQADFLQTPLVQAGISECTALGAAMLAGLGVDMFADRQTVASAWRPGPSYTPQRAAGEIAAEHARWQRAVERALDWAYDG